MQADSAQTPSPTRSRMTSHTKATTRNDKTLRGPAHPAGADLSQTHMLPKMLILACFSPRGPPRPPMLTTMQGTSRRPLMVVTVWPAPSSVPLPPCTLWHQAGCPQLPGSPERVESGWNSQPILGPQSCPATLSPSPRRQHQPHGRRPQHVRYDPMWRYSLPPAQPRACAAGEPAGLACLS